jgi:hypothetical protein
MIYGADGQPLSRENPFKQQTLDEMEPLSQEELDHLYSVCQNLIDQKVPPTVASSDWSRRSSTTQRWQVPGKSETWWVGKRDCE